MVWATPEERLRAMWKLVGREELMEDPRYLGKGADGDFWFQNVIPAIEGWSQQLSKWEVAEQLTEIGLSMGVAQTIADHHHVAALGIVLALESKRQSSLGQYVDMAMYECLVTHTVSQMNIFQTTGENPGRSRDRLTTAGLTFKARDGYVVMAGVRSEERLRAMWKLVGREELMEDLRYLGKGADGDFWFQNVIPAIEGWSQQLSKWEVAEQLTGIGLSMGVAQTIADLDQCPHLEARQMFVNTGDTMDGRFRSLKTPIRLTGCADPPAETPPELGEHNQAILCSIGGLSPEELAELESQGVV